MLNIRLSKKEVEMIKDLFVFKEYKERCGLDLEEYLLYKKIKEFLE